MLLILSKAFSLVNSGKSRIFDVSCLLKHEFRDSPLSEGSDSERCWFARPVRIIGLMEAQKPCVRAIAFEHFFAYRLSRPKIEA
jgi:hypothetical protein